MKIHLSHVEPGEIEKRSFEIIRKELGEKIPPPEVAPIVLRAIHATADFSYAEILCFSHNAVDAALSAIFSGAHVVTDTNMAAAGINRRLLSAFSGSVHCFMADEDVAAEAARRNVTRAAVSMERAARLSGPLVFVIGNAPTALVRLYELMEEGAVSPALVIGMPVGFVNVSEAKELILAANAPHIVSRGRKGGSNVAAAVFNALLLLAKEKRGDMK